MKELELKYLKTLAKQFPNIASATTEIINLESILYLPKGTEHYISDVHGEYEHFRHVIRNGSGSVRKKIEEEFGSTLTQKEKKKPWIFNILSNRKDGFSRKRRRKYG